MNKLLKVFVALVVSTVLGCSALNAKELTPELVKQVVTETASIIREQYVLPETGREVAIDLLARLESGGYDDVSGVNELSDLLTSHMRGVSNDAHISMFYTDPLVPTQEEFMNPSAEQKAASLAEDRYFNFGIRSVGYLDGNVGYFDLKGFMDAVNSAEALGTAMNMLKDTGGLVIDLRENYGGMPETVALLASYFLGPQSIHVDSIYWKETDTVEEFWTNPVLNGAWYGTERPLVILTSANTFSAAEAFTYAMQAFGRAEIVGETSLGGANPGGIQHVAETFNLFVPNGRAFSAVTGKNWEGVGVTPNYPVPADKALKEGHKLVLQKIIEQSQDGRAKQDRQMHLQRLSE
ncbi:MAG: S41 family peptidase [Pseudohongiellaceae bacterium]|nr:S41 family peptidase [Pseudohongiellaceae bacterium]